MFQGASTLLTKLSVAKLILSQKLELKAETITATAATAISVSTPLTIIDSTLGAIAGLVLADGHQGQVKFIVMMTANGAATITPAHMGEYAGTKTTITLDAAGESWMGIFYASKWYTVGTPTATIG